MNGSVPGFAGPDDPQVFLKPYLRPDEDDLTIWTPIAARLLCQAIVERMLAPDEELKASFRDVLGEAPPCPEGYSVAEAAFVGTMFCERIAWDRRPLCEVTVLDRGEDRQPEFDLDVDVPADVTLAEVACTLAVVVASWREGPLVVLSADPWKRIVALASRVSINAHSWMTVH